MPAQLRSAYVVAAPPVMGVLLSSLHAFAPLWPAQGGALLGAVPAACVEFATRPVSADLVAGM